MRPTLFVIALVLGTSPLFAQSRAYSNADLGHPLSSDRGRPELALATWLDHTGGIVPSIGETPRAEAMWIVGPVSDWNPTLSPTLPLSADSGVCYGCEFAGQHGFRSHIAHMHMPDRGPDVVPEVRLKPDTPRTFSTSVVMHAVGSRR